MFIQRMMWIVWPAFLVACVLEALVFAMLDPQDLHWLGQPIGMSRLGVYSVAFFLFWVMAMVSSGLTILLSMSSSEVNRDPGGHPQARP